MLISELSFSLRVAFHLGPRGTVVYCEKIGENLKIIFKVRVTVTRLPVLPIQEVFLQKLDRHYSYHRYKDT